VIKPAYSVTFLLSINIFVWQNVLYFPNDLRIVTSLIIYSSVSSAYFEGNNFYAGL